MRTAYYRAPTGSCSCRAHLEGALRLTSFLAWALLQLLQIGVAFSANPLTLLRFAPLARESEVHFTLALPWLRLIGPVLKRIILP